MLEVRSEGAGDSPGSLPGIGSPGRSTDPAGGGFSLVELVVVILVTGIMASAVGSFIAGPIQGYLDQARRGALVDAAQLALLRMGRDLRSALPNSVRLSGGAIEMLQVLDGDRYRAEPPGGANDRLEFDTADSAFNTLAQLDATGATGSPRLAIYPLGPSIAAADPYSSNVMTPATTAVNAAAGTSTVGGTTEYRVTMTPGHRFPFQSTSQRVFLVDGPVTYRCVAGELRRYSGYAVTPAQVVPPVGGTTATIVKNVENCAFSYAAGTAQRNSVVFLSLTLLSQEERVRLQRQVQVDNSP